jgi:IS5 family transposase
MPRPPTSSTIDEILRNAMEPVLKRASSSIAKAIADMAAARLDRELQNGIARGRGRRGAAVRVARGARRRSDITRWVADRRARRVPKFVIELTNGLDTKKKIVAKFGSDAVFEKGKPLPKTK